LLLKANLPLKADLLLKRVFCKKNTYKFLTKYVRGFSGCWLLANACASGMANQASKGKQGENLGETSKGKGLQAGTQAGMAGRLRFSRQGQGHKKARPDKGRAKGQVCVLFSCFDLFRRGQMF